ncbi:MAG: helix-turn-helix transcriptional regulator [Prevotella sp.]|nr:helix-turn-helix transcriptional regulator [Prevotella sp.]
MKKLILMVAILVSIASCTGGNGKSGRGSEADSIYTWENIRQYIFEKPEHAFAMVDTAETRGAVNANFANWMRAQIHLAEGSKEDIDKARDYCMMVLESRNPVADSLQRVKTYHLLVSIGKSNHETYQDAISYAIEGARISHENGWTGEEAMFYFDAGETMEKVQAGSGTEYMDQSLDLFRKSSNPQALPMFSSYLGNVARLAIGHEDYARAVKLTQERALVVDRIEKEYANAPAGYIDQQRAYVYSLLAYCQYKLGDKAAASRSAQAFENTKASRLPEHLDDILRYYIISGNALRTNEIYAVVEPYYRKQKDTISTEYASLLMTYASSLDRMGRSHEAYSQLKRYTILADSLVQRERRSETLKYAQQMKTQEKEMLLKDEEAKTRMQRVMLAGAAVIILLILWLLWRSYIYNKTLTAKNRELFAEVLQREKAERKAEEQLQACPQEELTATQQLYLRICQLMDNEKPFTNAELSREELAQQLGTNYKYVADAIRECSDGMTITDFLNHQRLGYAAHLLATTSDAVTLIADRAGFNNRSYFNRLFRERYKLTPSEYRKAAKEK